MSREICRGPTWQVSTDRALDRCRQLGGARRLRSFPGARLAGLCHIHCHKDPALRALLGQLVGLQGLRRVLLLARSCLSSGPSHRCCICGLRFYHSALGPMR